MTENSDKNSAADALKRALAAKKAASRNAGAFGGDTGAITSGKSVQRASVALNKPAFRRASKRG
ncbi:hypothetical protein [Brevundimonas diminuta]|uniref:hypothetical protein n=1 Tax=Brevundimonas diminuta TaxID=293 RepID=UPI003CFCA2C6